LLKDLRVAVPGLAVLIFSMHDELHYAERAMRAGARGYLMKGSSNEKLTTAIHNVLQGELSLSAKASSQILQNLAKKEIKEIGIEVLSDRELEIFNLIGKGETNAQIGERLHISPRTVEAHRSNIKTKLSLPDGSSLVRRAILWTELAEGRQGFE
jgi:DNA-binding NarL/FixJ family response regulator